MHQQGTSSEGSFVAMVVFFCVFYKVMFSQERKIILKLHFISSIKIKEWGLLLAQRGR